MYPINKNTSILISLSLLLPILFIANSSNIKPQKKEVSASTEFWKQPYVSNINYSKMSKTSASSSSVSKEKAQNYLKNNIQLGFKENKGQMADANGKPLAFVLFKAEAPNLNIWVTTTGLTYQFFKIEEEREGAEKIKGKRDTEKTEDLKVHDGRSSEWHRVDMVLKNATIKKENIITENDITQGAENYYLGHCPDGIFNVKTYTKITIKEIYKGIDWVLYTFNGGLKHDFIVHPQADPKQIKLLYEGSGEFEVENNHIHFKNEIGEVTEGKLLCYQGNEANEVKAKYNLIKNTTLQYLGAGNRTNDEPCFLNNETPNIKSQISKNEKPYSYELSIDVQNYNASETLIIDPELVWSTFYGSNSFETSRSIEIDNIDNIYITGRTSSIFFPLQNFAGAYNQIAIGVMTSNDCYILKFDNIGNRLWATYYGGSFEDAGFSIAINGNNELYVTGETFSSDFPIQNLTGAFNQSIIGGGCDGFILKFNNIGNRLWATYYGGSGFDREFKIAIDANNQTYITGETESTNFPIQTLAGAYNQIVIGGSIDAFILKFDNTCARLWATYYGGSSLDDKIQVAINGNNEVYITGQTQSSDFPIQNLIGAYNQTIFGGGFRDGFIIKFNNTGARLWCTYYGGSGDDYVSSVAFDSNNHVYVLGCTQSVDFPIQNLAGAYNQFILGGVRDAFILKLDNTGLRLWATYYGGISDESLDFQNENLVIDACNNVYISFLTQSNDLFIYNSGICHYNDINMEGLSDVFIIKINTNGSLLWTTYFGGDGFDDGGELALDSQNNLLIVSDMFGVTNSTSYPLTNPNNGAYFDNTFNGGSDIFIAKFKSLSTSSLTTINPTSCVCDGAVTVTVNCGIAPFNYLLSNGQSVVNSTVTVSTFSNLCSGAYQLTVTSAECGTNTYSFSLILADVELPYVNATAINPICLNTNGSMIVNAVSNITDTGLIPISNYTISEGSNIIALNQPPPFTISNISIGTHTYVVTNEEGCSNTFTINISNSTVLLVDAGVGATIPFGGSTNLLGTVPVNTTYTWSPSNSLSCVNCLNPVASPNATTIYTLSATDNNGCKIFDIVEIVVKERCSDVGIYLPNAFSPNGDGANDVFCIQDGQICINEVSLIVYDRWGDKVFETSNPAFCWDGTYKGKLLNSSVFVYYAKASFTNGKKIEKKGNVTLLR